MPTKDATLGLNALCDVGGGAEGGEEEAEEEEECAATTTGARPSADPEEDFRRGEVAPESPSLEPDEDFRRGKVESPSIEGGLATQRTGDTEDRRCNRCCCCCCC